jgi:hypothetical protein
MDITDLNQNEILQGSFSLIFVILSLIIGLLFLLKYPKNKQIEFITIGLTWIFFSSGWWGSAFSFLAILFFHQPLNLVQYLLISNMFIPFVLIVWIYSFCHLLYPELKKRGLIFSLIVAIPFDIVLIIMILINPSYVGRFVGTFSVASSLFLRVFEILLFTVMLITGVIFSTKSMKIEDPIIKRRGLLLLVAFLLLAIALVIDSLFINNPILIVVNRLVLISSAIIYYLAFFRYK